MTLLLEHGAPMSANRSGETALFDAATNGHASCVRALLTASLPKGIAVEVRGHSA